MFAAIHSRVAVSDLIQGIIVDSANDACIAVAEALAGNETAFGDMLTKRAREIGLQHSTFTNATGYSDPNLRVTARDMAELARHIMQTYPDFYPDFAQRDFTWDNIHQQNRNPLLGMGIDADGLKTGETAEAGFNLVGSAVQDNLRLIVVVTGSKDRQRARRRSAQTARLRAFTVSRPASCSPKARPSARPKCSAATSATCRWSLPAPIQVMVPRDNDERLLARIVYTGPVPAPIIKGQTIGQLKVWRGDDLALGRAAAGRRRCRHRDACRSARWTARPS